MKNNIKTFLFLSSLTILLILAGDALGGRQGAVLAFIIALAMNFVSYWFSDKLVLRTYRAREITNEQESRLYRIVKKLSLNAGIPMPRVYIIPERTPNAFATGRNPSHAAVAATEGILQILTDNELEGVMAHELAHVKNRDTLTSTVAATIAGAITLLGRIGTFSSSSDQKRNPLSIILIILLPFAAMLIRMLISRTREYAADEGGAEISGQPLALANALNKLHEGVARYPISRGSASDSHLFIMNPFIGGLQQLLSTHPPVKERIKKLEQLAQAR